MPRSARDKAIAGLDAVSAIAEGRADPATYQVHVPSEINVKALRSRLNLSQAEFASRFSFNPARVRDWEQGRSRPDGAVRAYLLVIDRDPEAVSKALQPQVEDEAAVMPDLAIA